MGATIKIAILAQAAKAKAEMQQVASRAKEMGDKVKESAKGFVRTGASIASFASLLGPASTGILALAHGLSVAAANAAALAPALALAPAVIGGWQFLKFTLSGIAAQMGETLKPLGEAFKAAQVEAGKLASKELPALSAAFQKVNLPNISDAMNRIGKATGDNVGFFGRWVNSASGVKLIKDTTDGVASAFERAAPSITAAVISLGNMANRAKVSDRLAALGDVVARLADKFNAWTDSVTSEDIDGALRKAGDAAGFVTDKLRAVKDVIGWMADNQEKVKAISDAIAGLGIVLGIATGNPVAVAIGAFTLLSNHWEGTKQVFSGASSWWSGVWAGMKASPELQSLGATLRESFGKIWAALQPVFEQIQAKVMPALQQLGRVVMTELVPAFDDFVQAITPVITILIGKLGPVVATIFESVVNVIRGAITIITGILKVFTGILTGDWSKAWEGVKSILSGAWTIIKAVVSAGVAQVKGVFSLIGPGLKALAESAWNLVKGAFTAGISAVVSFAAGLPGKVRSAIATLGGLILGVVNAAWTSAKSAFTSGVSTAVSTAAGLPGKVKAGLGNLGSYLYSAGQDIIRGLINGIKAMAGQAVSAAKGVVSDAVSGAKRLLGIASPSKVFAEIGRQTGAGFVLGLDGQANAAQRAAERLLDIPAAVPIGQGVIDVTRTAGGSSTPAVVLQFEASGDPVMDAIFEALRKRIRVSGGNVQLALGR